MLNKEIKYAYSDISIMPAVTSPIRSRSECNPYYEDDDYLPLFTAPMNSVVGEKSFKKYEDRKIHAILPRTVDLKTRLGNKDGWSAFSLGEFETYFVKDPDLPECRQALIDIANGHMESMITLARISKDKWKNRLLIMVGNIAHPETYDIIDRAGIDFVRVGIGSGRGCITSSNTSVHYPMASLIDEIRLRKRRCKVVADGGIRGYNDIIKALALGADYVMIGSVFAKMLESEGPLLNEFKQKHLTWKENDEFSKYEDGKFWEYDIGGWSEVKLYKEFYGMASKKGQVAMNGEKKTTSEGLITTLPVEYTMDAWVENFIDYLKSAMSYTGHDTLEDFVEMTDTVILSPGASGSINK